MNPELNIPRILGVLGGRDMRSDRVAAWARSADVVLAADGGANLLFRRNILPNATIGDLDSISASTKYGQTKLVYRGDQDSSDCDKLLAYAKECGYKEITLCGTEGDLLDHVLGTLQSAAKSPLKVRIALRRGIAWILRGPVDRTYNVPIDTRLSLMPIGYCSKVSLTGVEWPLSNQDLNPVGQTSLSNKTTGPVNIKIETGAAGLFLTHRSLEIPNWPE